MKKIYIEAMRIFAIFFVIFNHTGENGFFLFSQYHYTSAQFWVYLFLSIFCKFSVPLFFAISGALMLHKTEESIADIWKNRIIKTCFILFVFSLIYYLEKIYNTSGTVNIKMFLKSLYANRLKTHLWYLYAYIAFLISLPFLRSLVHNMSVKVFNYMIVLALFYTAFLPIFEYLLWQGRHTMNANLKLSWLVSNIVLYPCVGYFLEHRIDIHKAGKHLVWLWILDAVGLFISCCMTFYKGTIINEGYASSVSQTFHSNFVLLNCITIYLTLKYVFLRFDIPPIIKDAVVSIGKCTFGIYLLHMLVKDTVFMQNLLQRFFATGMNFMLACFIWCALVLLICYAITSILLRIPVIKKCVGG